MRPLTPTNNRAVVRSFGTLSGSVRAYIHNLNTHPYYENFRNARAALHDRPNEKKTKVLVKHLDRYAEIGPAYVTKLENLIRTNQFGRYVCLLVLIFTSIKLTLKFLLIDIRVNQDKELFTVNQRQRPSARHSAINPRPPRWQSA